MFQKIFVVGGAIIGSILGYLRTEDIVQDFSGVVGGTIVGALVGLILFNVLDSLLD